ncbi:MAG: hypothetical protein CMK25_03130 [Porticoccaceae bacterium]|nr:hypothetical protein [Porticoccaceae bacterium]
MVIVKNLFKWVSTGLIAVVTLFSAVIIYISFAVDINGFRPDIESAARQQGWELSLDGELTWTFIPQPGISISQVRFSDGHAASGTLETLTLSVAWTDLLSITGDPSQIKAGSVQIGGGQIRYQAQNSLPVQLDNVDLRIRKFSLDGSTFPLTASAQAFGGQQFAIETDIAVRATDGHIHRIGFSDLTIAINNIEIVGNIEASNQLNFIQGTLQTSRFNLAQQLQDIATLLPILSLPEFANPTALNELSIDSRFTIDRQAISDISNSLVLDGQRIDVHLQIDQQRNKLTTEITGDSLNLADYMSLSNNKANNQGNNVALFAPLAIPFALWQGQSQVEVTFDEILFEDLALDNFYSNIFGNQRVLRITSLNADLFGGQVNAVAKLDMRLANPSMSIQPSINDIELAQALPSLADNNELSGRMDLELNLQGSGNSIEGILQSLRGMGQISIASPQYKSINIEQLFCNAAALFGSSSANQQWSAGTQFEDFNSKFQFNDGNLIITDFRTATGNLAIDGRGTIGLISRKYTLQTNTELNGATTSSNGCTVNQRLQNRQIPFVCTGNFDQGAPSCKPDERAVKALIRNSAVEQLGSKLLKNNDTDQQTDPLKSLFNDFLQRKLN